jgi:hypothetical protein
MHTSVRLWSTILSWLRRRLPAPLRRATAEQLRDIADELDPYTGFRYAGAGFRYDTRAQALTVDWTGRYQDPTACPLWYRHQDYDRAWVDFDRENPWPATEKR